jgi:hypothetical protein
VDLSPLAGRDHPGEQRRQLVRCYGNDRDQFPQCGVGDVVGIEVRRIGPSRHLWTITLPVDGRVPVVVRRG